MLKLPLAGLAVGVMVSSASAQSVKPQENGPDYLGSAQSFKCEAIWPTNNPIVAGDPPGTVMVSIKFSEGTKTPFELRVVHVAESGEKYNRADEYRELYLVALPDHRDYSWFGAGIKNRNLMIHRQLFEKDSSRFGANRWFYNEELFEYGRRISEFQSVCHKTG